MKLIFLILAFVCFGCIERNINPFEEEAGFFSVYGALDVNSNLNYIRIKDTQVPALPETLNLFDGTVTFEELNERVITTLKDTVVDFSGFHTHNFIVDQPLLPQKTYLLKVEGPNGKTVITTTKIPDITELTIVPNRNVRCNQQVEFTFDNIEYPEHVRMEVGLKHGGKINWTEIGLVGQLEHRKTEKEMYVSLSPQNILVEVFPPGSLRPGVDPRTLQTFVNCNDLDSEIIHIRYKHLSKDWDIFRPGWFPVDPLEWQDVENGLGFLGAFREGTATFIIDLPEDD